MFWKKKIYSDNQLGNLKYSQGYWSTNLKIAEFGECIIDVAGEKYEPNTGSLQQAKKLLRNIAETVEEAKKFIETKDVKDFMDGHGHLVFDGFFSNVEIGNFDIQFGLSDWDDATIIVHFKNNAPWELSLGD